MRHLGRAASTSAASEWVFAYGSLAADVRRGYVTELAGHRRRWGVAMDNRRDLPGYKWYRLRATGERPAVMVAFLDLVADADAAGAAGSTGAAPVNGLCLPVDAAALRLLDARERNYARVDVTAQVAEAYGRVWAYRGTAAGRGRLTDGLRRGVAVVSAEYVDDVEHAFRRLGDDQLAAYRASTDPLPPGCATVSLERVDLR